MQHERKIPAPLQAHETGSPVRFINKRVKHEA